MGNLAENRKNLREEFSDFSDPFDRYSYLVEIASLLPPYPEEKRDDIHLVKGCQSHVWLNPYIKEGKFFFDADSDTRIIKGVLLLLQDLLCDIPVTEVAAVRLDVLEDAGLKGSFSDTRQKGIASAVEILRSYAADQVSS